MLVICGNWKTYRLHTYPTLPIRQSPLNAEFSSVATHVVEMTSPIAADGIVPPITPHPQHDQQHTRDSAECGERDSQVSESHSPANSTSTLWRVSWNSTSLSWVIKGGRGGCLLG